MKETDEIIISGDIVAEIEAAGGMITRELIDLGKLSQGPGMDAGEFARALQGQYFKAWIIDILESDV